jgi:putative zinc finger/helix-turn-helix YgiT family protein
MTEYPIKGEVYNVEVSVAVCPHCLSIVPHRTLDRFQRHVACNAYRKAHGLLTDGQIRSVRSMYDLSQRALARILGWSPVTIHRYEQGGIQNRAHDTVLRLAARDPEFMLARLELVREGLSAMGYARLRHSIENGAKLAARMAEHCA